ncbi:uncharacterized protein LOC108911978 [Anoplophora glabripennis]|uniref:uncharacterized protein LOC108911978 n=1 Tax=Anoplophora glabripennis TaxID=217634 RepID=UPI000C76FA2E|nr:uncharacterized protein LOC108911978 [Anoplophora glabripennis]
MLHCEGASCQFFTFNENILLELKSSAEIYLDKNLQGKGFDKEVVTDENVRDFLNHLQFFSNYPSGNKLDKIIERLLTRLNSSALYRKVSSQEIYKKIEDWFKQPKGEYLTEDRAKIMFGEIKSDKYCEQLKNYYVSFKQDDAFSFTDTKRIFHVSSQGGHLLPVLKIYHALQKDESKKLYVNPEDALEVQRQILEAFGLSRYTFLVITGVKITEETAIKEICGKLKDAIKKCAYKKVILVAEPNDRLGQQIGPDDIFHVDGSVTFEDLSEECQKNLVNKKNICFQGEEVSLEELLTTQASKDWARAVDSDILERLIRNKRIKVGVPTLDLNDGNSRCYVRRTFKRQVYKSEGDQDSDELRVELSPTIPLSLVGESGDEISEEIFSEEGMYGVMEDVVLISDGAGMGKSTVVARLATLVKERNPHLWVIKIELSEYTVILRDLKKSGESLTVTKLLNSEKATELTNHLERFVFSVDKKVVLVLDGIDEISPDYTGLVLDLLTQCLQAANFAKLFVTTRPHMVRELEEVLKVKPFVMQPFTEQNQVDFLASYWLHNLSVDVENKGKCEQYARALINRMSSWTKGYYQKEDDFTAIPLQLVMLAEIFQESIKQKELSYWEGCMEYLKETRVEPKLPEKMRIKELFEMFIVKKRDIYIYKGNPTGTSMANRALIKQFNESLTWYRKLALEMVLHQKDCQLFSRYRQSCEDIDEDTLIIGIVQVSNGGVRFIHRTFAEYFVTESLIDELQLQSRNPNVSFQEFFIDHILKSPNYKIIRAFLDNFLQKAVDPIPPNIFECYRSQACHFFDSTHYDHLVHLLAREGCVAVLQLILESVHFRAIRDKEVNIEDLPSLNTDANAIASPEIERNTLNVIQVLVREGGLNIRNRFGLTPLHEAARNGHSEMVRYLSEQGAKIDSRDAEGYTAMHLAAMKGDLDSVEYLARTGGHVNIKDNAGLTPLHFAAWNGQLDTVKFLIGLGADFKAVDEYNRTPLRLAALKGHLDTVKFLLRKGEDVNDRDSKGFTALHYAAANGHLDTIEFLLELGADFSVGDNEGGTPLHLAARRGQTDVVVFFVKLSGDVNVADDKGRTTLHFAASSGHSDIIKFLHKLGADLVARDNEGLTALHLAASYGHLDTARFLLEQGVSVNVGDNDATTPLHFAVHNSHLDMVRFLLELSADFNARDHAGTTPLHLAASNGHLDIVKHLLELGADFDVRDNDGATLLHLAAREGQLVVVEFLVQLNDVNIKDSNGRTPLHFAAAGGHLEAIRLLLDLGADYNVGDNEGMTALHFAAANGRLHAVKFFVELGVDVNVGDNDDSTPLHLAARGGQLTVVEYLVKLNGDVNIADNNGMTALHFAAANCHLDTMKFLVGQGADPNIRNKDERTAMDFFRQKSFGYGQNPSF